MICIGAYILKHAVYNMSPSLKATEWGDGESSFHMCSGKRVLLCLIHLPSFQTIPMGSMFIVINIQFIMEWKRKNTSTLDVYLETHLLNKKFSN